MAVELTATQRSALSKVIDYLFTVDPKPYYTLGGLAGTGKTTVLAALCEALQRDGYGFVVGTPTGKAASVLCKKGVPAATLHRLCYTCAGKDKRTGELIFDFVGIKLDDDAPPVSALIIDEASMVSTDMLTDLRQAGVKLVFVGDHGQLPPVKGDPHLMQQLDSELTEVHRQKDQLLELCYAFRESRVRGGHFTQNEEIARYATHGTERSVAWSNEADIILTSTNKTRHYTNWWRLTNSGLAIPPLAKLSEKRTELGELLARTKKRVRLCVMVNDYDEDLYNGELGWFEPTDMMGPDMLVGFWFETEEDEETGRQVVVNTNSFFRNPGAVPFYDQGLKCDFGYAITVHKAQGSEWDHVAVIDSGPGKMADPDQYLRWRYTACTRAKKRVTWVGMHRR